MVVANGGLKTKPSYKHGRKPYNRDSMRPSLVVIEASSGKLLDRYELENPFLSIRHLCISDDGETIAMAIQDREKGAVFSGGPLLAVRHRGGRVVSMQDERGIYSRMSHHTLSVALSVEHSLVATTSPRGDLVAFWSIETGALQGSVGIEDARGIALAAHGREFVVTTRQGTVHYIDAETLLETVPHHGLETENATGWGSHLKGSLG